MLPTPRTGGVLVNGLGRPSAAVGSMTDQPRRFRCARIGDQLDPFDDLAPPHLEDLDDRAGRPQLEAERVAIAELRARHLLLARPQRLDGPDRVAQLRRLLEPLLRRGLGHPLPQRRHQLVVASFEKQLGVLHRDAVLLLRAQRADARGRHSA